VWWTQTLSSPYLNRCVSHLSVDKVEEPCFLHLKHCKKDAYADYSADYLQMVTANLTLGPPLRPDWQDLLRQWQLL
jgi:hypothetical protein